MKADTSPPIKTTRSRSARATTTKAARSNDQGPLPGKGPWFRLDGIWYTQDEAGKWFRMPGQPEERTKREKEADPS